MSHEISRVRHELRRRTIVVKHVEWITPGMKRIRFGEELAGFTSLSADDHLKIFVPDESGELVARDYTPRRFDAGREELEIDFAMHEAGPVTAWARDAEVGDSIGIGGPRGSVVVPYDFDWWLLIGDETALPAIGRRLEEMPSGVPVTAIIAVADKSEQQIFVTKANLTTIWVHRALDRADAPEPLISALRDFTPPPGEGYVWIAAEASVARALRQQVTEQMKHPAQWLKASGYWVKGKADSSEKSIE